MSPEQIEEIRRIREKQIEEKQIEQNMRRKMERQWDDERIRQAKVTKPRSFRSLTLARQNQKSRIFKPLFLIIQLINNLI